MEVQKNTTCVCGHTSYMYMYKHRELDAQYNIFERFTFYLKGTVRVGERDLPTAGLLPKGCNSQSSCLAAFEIIELSTYN